MAPMASEAWLSVLETQVAPESVVSQIPPPAAPIYQWVASVGSTAIAAVRPLTFRPVCELVPIWPFNWGAGPRLAQWFGVGVEESPTICGGGNAFAADICRALANCPGGTLAGPPPDTCRS